QRTYVLTGEGFAHWMQLHESDRLFTCLPMSHINARAYSVMGALAAGASLAVEERFSASRLLGWLSESGATELNAIGAMLHIMMRTPPSDADRRHSLRLVYSAPALGEEAHLAFEERFGVRLIIGYGLTESTYGLIHPLSGERRLHSMGRPRHHPDAGLACEVRLVDAASDPGAPRETAEGEVGEIWLRNPAVFDGYFRDEEATRQTVTADGWLRTGDLARREPGEWYTFVARAKEIIRRGGENIAPAEVEAALMSHPDVQEAAVIGAPSSLGEEDVAAFVIARPGATLTPIELDAWCRARLAAFKVPAVWRLVDELPRTPTQRVAKHLLRVD
ncbi:MAG TPA: AMP-binding protein, partial [Candidatus Polarisedimenticolia bacterium]|nr:AMP-binding protein [Candidatus Polarisedimenticolia bacterium]